MRNVQLPRFASVALTIAALTAAGCGGGEGQQGAAQRPPPQVGVVALQTQDLERTAELPGRTAAYRVAAIRPQVGGTLEERLFEAGAQVEAGEALYRIDPEPYRAAVEEAEARLAEAEATVDTARKDVERIRELLETNGASEQELDAARDRLEQNRAQVQAARAALSAARIELGYTTVEAPISGRISQTLVTEGALVSAHQEAALARVTQLDPIYVDLQRSAEQARRLKRALARGELERAGDGAARVELLLGGGEAYAHAGRLEFSGVTVERGTGSLTLRAVFPNPDHELMPGMFVRARLTEGVERDALLVPQQGVSRNRQGQATALVVNDAGKVEQRVLSVDRAEGSYWVVEEGLAEGDRVIVSGLQKVRPGQEVRPVSADIPNQPEGADHG
ncbi:efflux RND transporter periplasmic adaptor subunit [Halorhodospira neutriphila]|uniref:Efflux transporter periplasmic adaptor subunit n=1 Tax=Halorhodospira neutriphila TaxID=168379 RepID=A0ABS1E6I4_9GAMM|nr:efflux RND transporter periplasmic adaptor subunit [Halorhodospira neutriphila]MBK1725904.1 efflux transporter periplasmic adaptor subunit [Halorhodospira neutriphila]